MLGLPGPSATQQATEDESQQQQQPKRPLINSIEVSCTGGNLQAFSVVSGEIPDHLLTELQRDFTAEEVDQIFARIHKTLAPSVERPAALFVFGPSAVGKSVFSAAQATALFGSDNNAVVVDGAEFREVHAGWQAVAAHGQQHKVLHSDAWSLFRAVGGGSGISSKLKKRILGEAIRDRQHMIIPDCANNPTKLQANIEQVIAAGYELHAICLWAPLAITRARGEPRSMREGKLWSPSEYALSTRGSLAMALQWTEGMRDRPGTWRSLALWDNSHFPAEEISLPRFVELTSMTDEEGRAHAARAARLHAEIHTRVLRTSSLAVAKLKRSLKRRASSAVQRNLEAARSWGSGIALDGGVGVGGVGGGVGGVGGGVGVGGGGGGRNGNGLLQQPALDTQARSLAPGEAPPGILSAPSLAADAAAPDAASSCSAETSASRVSGWREGNRRFARRGSAVVMMATQERRRHQLEGAVGGALAGLVLGALLGAIISLAAVGKL